MIRTPLIVAFLAGCSFNSASSSSGDDGGPGPNDARIDAIPDAAECTAVSAECVGDTLRTCSGANAMAVDTPCNWGCDPQNDRCHTLDPAANAIVPTDLEGSTIELTLAEGATIDTDDDTVPGVTIRNNTAVFSLRSLHITGNITVTGSNALAFAVAGEVSIDGIIDMRGTCTDNVPGPGGFAGGSAKAAGLGPGGGGANSSNKFAGGGGGYGGTGGAGASATAGTTTAGGIINGDDVIMTLRGGSGGGGGAGGGNADGGGGGGAIHIASNTSITFVSGGINAGGCGGESKSGGNDGGGGGGAGGTILLEAPTVTLSATSALAVNGGGGGGGDMTTPADGQDGLLSANPADGANSDVGGDGGNGAAGLMPNGSNGETVDTFAGGGGGGAIGRIRINVKSSADLTITSGATLSPPVSTSGQVTTCTVGDAALL